MSSSPADLAAEKRALRRDLRRRRRALDARTRRRAETRLARRLGALLAPARIRDVALYRAVGSELSLDTFMARCRRRPLRFWLPVLRGPRLQFLPAHQPLQRGPHGLLQPTRGRPRPAWAMDLILLPLLGFDSLGHRLGQGGGYYDRWLATLRHRRPRVVGIAFDCQQLTRLPAAPWDIPLDAVVTPTRTLTFDKAFRR